MTRQDFRDPRLLLLSTALSLALLALFAPQASVKRASFDALVVVDITGSMNTRDYGAAGRPVSRLEFVKTALVEMVGESSLRFACRARGVLRKAPLSSV